MPTPRETPTPREMLDRLETRHDELLRKLDDLNADIEQALAQFGKARATATDATSESPTAPPVEARPRRRAA
jgi:hypothetical protein